MQLTKGTKLISFALVLLFLFHMPMTPVVAQNVSGHTDYVNTLAWNPSGDTLASGSTDQSVILWNEAGEFVDVKKSTLGPNGSVLDVGWTSDGNQILAGDTDDFVFGFNATEGDQLPTIIFDNHNGYVKTIAIDPSTNSSNAIIASGGDGSNIRLWQLDNSNAGFEQMLRVQVPSGVVRDLQFSSDGEILAMIHNFVETVDGEPVHSGILKIYNATLLKNFDQTSLRIDGESEFLLAQKEFDYQVFSMEMNSAGNQFVVASVNGITTYTSVSGTTVLSEIGSSISVDCSSCINMGLEFSPDESKIAFAASHRVEVYSYNSGIDSSVLFELNTEDLDFNKNILAVDVTWHPSGTELTFAAGADILHYNFDTGDQIFSISGEIPEANNIVFIVGVIIILVIVLIYIIRRQIS